MPPSEPVPPTVDRRGEAGVTIVELIAVVVLVVAVGAVVWVSTTRIQHKGRAVECRDELREVKVAVMDYTALAGKPPTSTDTLIRTKDPVRGGLMLDDPPKWYSVGPGGTITRTGGAPSTCPTP